jgi:hypothetical protein
MYNRIGSKPDFKIKPPTLLNFEMLCHTQKKEEKTPTLLRTYF